MKWPQGTFISKIDVDAPNNSAKVVRETDTGSETISFQLPAVITCDLRLNEPRYAKLQNMYVLTSLLLYIRPETELWQVYTEKNICIPSEVYTHVVTSEWAPDAKRPNLSVASLSTG